MDLTRIRSLLIAALAAMSLVGCGSESETPLDNTGSQNNQTSNNQTTTNNQTTGNNQTTSDNQNNLSTQNNQTTSDNQTTTENEPSELEVRCDMIIDAMIGCDVVAAEDREALSATCAESDETDIEDVEACLGAANGVCSDIALCWDSGPEPPTDLETVCETVTDALIGCDAAPAENRQDLIDLCNTPSNDSDARSLEQCIQNTSGACDEILPCAGIEPDPASQILDTPLSGTVEGAPWSFVSGYAKPNLDGTGLVIRLAGYDEVDPCGFMAFSDDPYIWWTAPNQPTTEELGLQETVVFEMDGPGGPSSYNLTNGAYTIDQVGPDTVKGGLYATGFGDSVNGQWEVTLCND